MVNYSFPGIITVRTKSKRLPNKCLKKFGKKTVIDHVIDRCIYYSIEPIVCTTTNTEDDYLLEVAPATTTISSQALNLVLPI